MLNKLPKFLIIATLCSGLVLMNGDQADGGGTKRAPRRVDGDGIELTGNVLGIELDGATLTKGATGLKITTDWAGAGAGTIHIDNYIEGGDGTDGTAIHDDTVSEISTITNKAVPVGGDFLLIEDSAAGNAKKHILISALPGGSGEINTASNLGGGLANWDSKLVADLRFNTFSATDFDLTTNLITVDATIARLASPTFTTPTLGAATATTVNLITITQPATNGTLTIQEGFTATFDGNATVQGTNTGDNTVATTGDDATAFFSSGTIEHERGGLEADVSAGDGFVEIKGGATTVIKSNLNATTDPGVTDDSTPAGYAVGSRWINVTLDKEFICLDATDGAAVWTETTGAGSTPTQIVVADTDMTVADAGAGTITATVDTNATGVWTVAALTIGGADATDQLILPQSTDPVTPTLAFGTGGNTGFYETSDGIINFASNGGADFKFTGVNIAGLATRAGTIRNETASATNPTVGADDDDFDSGLGAPVDDQLSLIVGATEALRVEEGANGSVIAGETVIFLPTDVTGDPGTPAADTLYLYVKSDSLFIKNDLGTVTDLGASGSGEVNTASNLGGGLANWDSKSVADLRFNTFSATDFDLTTNLITVDATIARLASPTFTTPTLGVATATSINKIVITQPATVGTLTIQEGFTATFDGNATVQGTNTGDNTVATTGDSGVSFFADQDAGTNLSQDLEEEGEINATAVTGNAGAVDQMVLGTTTNTASWINMPTGGTDGCSAAVDTVTYTASTDSWGCGTDADSGGATALNAIGDGAAAGSVEVVEWAQDWNWTSGTTAAALDAMKLTWTFPSTVSTDVTTQHLLSLENLDNAGDATGQIEALLHIDNADANDAPLYGIRIDDTQAWGSSALLLPLQADVATPTLAFGDGDSGFYESVDDVIGVSIAGTAGFAWNAVSFFVTGGPALQNEVASATNPNHIPTSTDSDSGIGAAAADQVSLIAGATEAFRIEEGANGSVIAGETVIFLPTDVTGDPGTPAADTLYLYVKSDSLFIKNDLGTVTDLGGGGSSEWTDTGAPGVLHPSDVDDIVMDQSGGTAQDTNVYTSIKSNAANTEVALEIENLVDNAAIDIMNVIGPIRSTAVDGDYTEISFHHDDITSFVSEKASIRSVMTDVGSSSSDHQFEFYSMAAQVLSATNPTVFFGTNSIGIDTFVFQDPTDGTDYVTLTDTSSVFNTSLIASDSLTIPQGTAPVVNSTGEIALDTDDVPAIAGRAQLVYADAADTIVLPGIQHGCYNLHEAVAGDLDHPVHTFPYAVTVAAAWCTCYQNDGTACSANGIIKFNKNSAGTQTDLGTQGNITCADETTTNVVPLAFSGGTLTMAAYDKLEIDVVTAPEVDNILNICFSVTVDRI